MAAFSQALLALVPAPEAPFDAYLPAFRAMAALLLNGATLRIAGAPHRLTEVEFYVDGHAHADPFAHGDAMQRRGGHWYFHRTGGEYRGGTYKGLDVAIGNEALVGGVLVRGVEQLAPEKKLFDGPCLAVDHALALTKSGSIGELVGRFDLKIDAAGQGKPESPLFIEHAGEARGAAIFETARVGLTLKKSASVERQRYLAQPYRFLTEPRAIKKGKQHLAVALHRAGKSLDEIVLVTGAPRASVARYVGAFEAGKGKNPEGYRGDLSTEQLGELWGACDHFVPRAAGAIEKKAASEKPAQGQLALGLDRAK